MSGIRPAKTRPTICLAPRSRPMPPRRLPLCRRVRVPLQSQQKFPSSRDCWKRQFRTRFPIGKETTAGISAPAQTPPSPCGTAAFDTGHATGNATREDGRSDSRGRRCAGSPICSDPGRVRTNSAAQANLSRRVSGLDRRRHETRGHAATRTASTPGPPPTPITASSRFRRSFRAAGSRR